ncbi:GTPase HflX [Shouchella miscanthi]|uniref:GTPase HflX n=1 Tax=Shouchella miscanthi TaxID=2598861 RepID=A0ABU6NEN6_9BACI|nr:GTPase HflX [Shouchella miscanthi]MED4126663.1 GTPase HflX [Shouchella miscanthi]
MHETETRTIQDIIVVGVERQGDSHFDYGMEELENLARALDLNPVASLTQKLQTPNQATYLGSGKVTELSRLIDSFDVHLAIFNDELTPSQIRNLEKELEVTVYDRTMLILDIFGERAKTNEAQLQVEIARLKYLLPRLVGMRASLSRQGGSGSGLANRGAGETKLELDRRKIESRISALERELEVVVERRQTQRQKRKTEGIPVVALVGYTNAGKSSLLNAFVTEKQEKKVFEKDMLFATLDTSVRRVEMQKNLPFLLADTVGFVSKLPTHLVKAFRSTLEEAREADLLLHVVDYSSSHYKEMMRTTENTLKELEIDQPLLSVYNKMDRVETREWSTEKDEIFLSAKTGQGMDRLVESIQAKVFTHYIKKALHIPYEDSKAFAYVNEHTHILEQLEDDTGWYVETMMHEKHASVVTEYEKRD